MVRLEQYQWEAIDNLHNGSILCGGVGSGKSLTSLGYYYQECGGTFNKVEGIGRDGNPAILAEFAGPMTNPLDLIIITTAQKRDKHEWDNEVLPLGLSVFPEYSKYENRIVIDSWNNIEKYENITNSFFIFDEQRVVGYGTWSKTFISICKRNKWILLSATPGDKWLDYAPVFIANGFYKHITDFKDQHVVYSYHVGFPQVKKYINEPKLERFRDFVLVDMDFHRNTVWHEETVMAKYDKDLYKRTLVTRKNPWEKLVIGGREFEKPIDNASEFCNILRKICNNDPSRPEEMLKIVRGCEERSPEHVGIIVFYNFTYELETLLNLDYGPQYEVAQWNGKKHEPVPSGSHWIYLVQYNAGSEGWNCITTNYMVFYSQSYSYRQMTQAHGRIDRANTPFVHLYYWTIRTTSNIDLAINRTLGNKKKFNAAAFSKKQEKKNERSYEDCERDGEDDSGPLVFGRPSPNSPLFAWEQCQV